MNLVAWPVLLPLVTAAALLFVNRSPRWRTILATSAALLTLIVDIVIVVRVLSGQVLVVQMAGWPAPYGISLVADGLSGIMVLLSGIIGLFTVLFAASSLQHPPRRGQGALLNRARERLGAQALLQFLFMGVNMSFLTGDVFNLFVAFEVMLIASYGLLLLGGELPQLREGFKYVIINLVASAVFVLAAGLAYGLFGTLNMADIAVKLEEHGGDVRVTLVSLLLALAFATKAALFPLGFWLPNSYPTPPAAVSAFFAAILTKVGAYALIRSFTLMFPAEDYARLILLALAGATMLIGGFGALSRRRWRHLFAFANVASIGYLIMGAFGGGRAGLSAGLYYLVHSVLVMFALYLMAALGERIAGENYQVEGHLRAYPWLGAGYFVTALALAGIPPTSGFVGKFALITALFSQGGALRIIVAVSAVATSFLLLYAGMRVWQGFFWGEADAVHRVPLPGTMRAVTIVIVGLVLLLAVASGPIFSTMERVAAQLEGNQNYIRAVLPASLGEKGE